MRVLCKFSHASLHNIQHLFCGFGIFSEIVRVTLFSGHTVHVNQNIRTMWWLQVIVSLHTVVVRYYSYQVRQHDGCKKSASCCITLICQVASDKVHQKMQGDNCKQLLHFTLLNENTWWLQAIISFHSVIAILFKSTHTCTCTSSPNKDSVSVYTEKVSYQTVGQSPHRKHLL